MADNFNDTITIKFQPDGDRELIGAIQALDRATKSMLNTQASMQDFQKRGFKESEKGRTSYIRLKNTMLSYGKTLKDVTNDEKLLKLAKEGNTVAIMQLSRAVKKYTRDLDRNKKSIVGTVHDTRILGGSFAVLRSKLLLVSFATGLVSASIGRLIKLYGRQEDAERLLFNALGHKNQALLDSASAIQQVTIHGDESNLELMRMAFNLGIAEESLTVATKSAIGLSTALGIDANAAMRALALATQGNTDLLNRYIPALRTVATEQEKANIINETATKGYEQAKEKAEGMAGSLTQIGNIIGDAGEEMAKFFIPIVKALGTVIGGTFEVLNGVVSALGDGIIAFTGTGNAAEDTAKEIEELNLVISQTPHVVEMAKSGITEYGKILKQTQEAGADFLALEKKRIEASIALAEGLSFAKRYEMGVNRHLSDTERKLLEEIEEKLAVLAVTENSYQSFERTMLKRFDDLEREKSYVKDFIKTYPEQAKKLGLVKEAQEEVNNELLAAKEIAQANKVIYKDNLDFQLMQIQDQADAYRAMKLDEVAVNEWAENAKRDAVIANLEETSAMYNSFIAGYDTFINSLTDMEMTWKERREKILNSIKSGFIQFVGEMIKERIKQTIAEELIAKSSQAATVASAQLVGKAIASTYAIPAALANTASFGAASQAGLQSIIGTVAATKALAKFEDGGLVGGRRHSQGGTIIEAEQGEFVMSRRAVQSIGVETLNQINQGGGAGITVNINAPMVDETVVDYIIPAIEKAQRMNLA